MAEQIQLKLTPIERRLYEALADGEPHKPEELYCHLDDDLAEQPRASLQFHLCNLRRKVGAIGETVIAQSCGNHVKYRRVILLNPALKYGS